MKVFRKILLKSLRYSVLGSKEKKCNKCYPNCKLCAFYTEDGAHHCLPLNVWSGLLHLEYKL